MLGSANKLKTARTISLSGAVSGSASFNGSGNVTITTTQANIAVLTGTLSYNEATINYPSGYNKNNCVVLTAMFQHPTSQNGTWGEGSLFNSSSYVTGSLPHKVNLRSDAISVEVSNILLSDGKPVNIFDIDLSFNYKIILMKIS